MKPGDMGQIDYEAGDRALRQTVALGAGILALMLMALFIGVFFGWLIWGI
jgi:hypothetical protein